MWRWNLPNGGIFFVFFAQWKEKAENAEVLSCEIWNIEARRCLPFVEGHVVGGGVK